MNSAATQISVDNVITRFINQDQLPLLIESKKRKFNLTDFLEMLTKNQTKFKELVTKYGGILFRNFPVRDAEDFSCVIKSLGLGDFVNYIGGDSPRNKVKGGVYTSTEAPPSIKIPLHNELSFVKYYPKHIYFFCEIEPQHGGETTIADARKIYQEVDPHVKSKFSKKGLRYVSHYYERSYMMDFVNRFQRSHKSWYEVLEVTRKEEAEQKCKDHEFEFKWHKNNWLEISQQRPAFLQHEETKEAVWFNQAHLYDFNPKLIGNYWLYLAVKMFYCRRYTRLHEVFFGDATKIPREDLYHVMDILNKKTIYFPWQKGDVLVLDNVLAMHGRAAFKGKRRILTAMTA